MSNQDTINPRYYRTFKDAPTAARPWLMMAGQLDQARQLVATVYADAMATATHGVTSSPVARSRLAARTQESMTAAVAALRDWEQALTNEAARITRRTR